ncbi:MAG: lipoyl(octanoyl) transferase LipB [Porphyromonas sp.]|nr:lipoyl(octanoyl) transferase LipB [Porphyromonas sp.]
MSNKHIVAIQMRPIHIINAGKVDYAKALELQTTLFDQLIELKHIGQEPEAHYLIFCEHNPVFTLGKHAQEENILISEEFLASQGIQVHHINRGGDVTYHGPGQWTVYPIFDLEEMELGIRKYVENLEEVAIEVLRKYGLKGERMEGASGVWMHTDSDLPLKVCAIGIKASRFVTMHGIAFNVTTPPDAYRWINPCGFTDRGVTNLQLEAGHGVTMDEARVALEQAFSHIFNRPTLEVDR